MRIHLDRTFYIPKNATQEEEYEASLPNLTRDALRAALSAMRIIAPYVRILEQEGYIGDGDVIALREAIALIEGVRPSRVAASKAPRRKRTK